MQATTSFEFERPENWTGEIVDMDSYDGEVDYFELEVEGDVVIEIDSNYGADRDGNRGMAMDFSYVEDITIILDGDFRPFSRKVRDFFLVPFKKAVDQLTPVLGPGPKYSTKSWESLKDNAPFRFKALGDEILLDGEQESIEENLFEAVADYEPDYEPDYDRY